MTKETLVKKLINNDINYNNAVNVDSKSYYYNMAYILVRQIQFHNEDEQKYIYEAIEDSELYKKVLSFAFARTEKSINERKNMLINNKLTEIKNLIVELECLIKNN